MELCANLELDGLTPSRKLIVEASRQLNIPLRIMIRPRGGDFIYSAEELKEMIASIEFCKKIGVEGVVFGILNSDGKLELGAIRQLTDMAAPLKVVFHKAIDHSINLIEGLAKLIKIKGITSVLTSGGGQTAMEGKETIKEMLQLCGDRIEIVPAGKITNKNLHELHEYFGARAYHGKRIVGDLS
ncbi:copper homeostasis protein CutC [Gramella sp. AN32]|uniref:Copper homeostasis protein cutC homolog n=1 Tax=Christiangramia antarctica TaxID=2058158 RepID=A0ABW5X4Y4_9FLAO|nr:copper homeostasis protein [Gramella sp. AN32]